MFKYLLILTLLLSACTRGVESTEDASLEPTEEQNQYISMDVSTLLSYMGMSEEFLSGTELHIDPAYREAYSLLSPIQASCMNTGFREYRECMIVGNRSIRDEFDTITGRGADLDIYITSLEQEILYMPHYGVLDTQPMPEGPYIGTIFDEIPRALSCYSILTGSVSYTNYTDTGMIMTIPIDLGYQDTAHEELMKLFPSWRDAREIPISAKYYNCSWMTFGPEYGTIIYAFEQGDSVYLFIKNADGGGSGDFDYSVFVVDRETQEVVHLGSFYAYGGIIPFPLVRNDDNGDPMSSGREIILDSYQNRAFLFRSEIGYHTKDIVPVIQSMIEQSIR